MVIIAIGILAGITYPLLSREYYDPLRILNGVIIGFLGGSFIVLNEIWLRNMVIRRLRFSSLIILKSIQYSSFFFLLIIMVISIDRSRRFGMGLVEYWQSAEFSRLVWQEDFFIIVTYALVGTAIFIFFYTISKKMGQGVLGNFIIGRYHKPRIQNRIFMYIDLNNSTTIAEKLGDVNYHKLLNQFFYDITDSLVLNYGRIYRYIGDQVVVSWSLTNGLQDANYIRAFFSAREQIIRNKEDYSEKYGIVPRFSAAVHCGEVVTGELGEVKSEISFLGEVLRETAVIEKACTEYQADLLVSRKLFDKTPPLNEIKIRAEYSIAIPGSPGMKVVQLEETGSENG